MLNHIAEKPKLSCVFLLFLFPVISPTRTSTLSCFVLSYLLYSAYCFLSFSLLLHFFSTVPFSVCFQLSPSLTLFNNGLHLSFPCLWYITGHTFSVIVICPPRSWTPSSSYNEENGSYRVHGTRNQLKTKNCSRSSMLHVFLIVLSVFLIEPTVFPLNVLEFPYLC